MPVEDEIFQRKKPDMARLTAFGFIREGAGYRYAETFMDGNFRAEVRVSSSGAVSGRVVEPESEEEFLPLHAVEQTGAFVGTVREGYAAILRNIAAHCFTPLPFLHDQANRIAELLFLRYGDRPDYPFARLPTYGVFRHPSSRKWYGLVMNIPRERLLRQADRRGGKPPVPPAASDEVEILNLKINPAEAAALLQEKGVYPCYHMNRANWASLLLEGILPDGRVMELLDASRAAAAPRAGRVTAQGKNLWLIPANPVYYDVEAAFARTEVILWKQSTTVRPGDVVYMYLAAPVSAIVFKCAVVEANIPYEYEDSHVRMHRAMRLRLLRRYARTAFPLAVLQTCGVGAVRGPRHVPPRLLEVLEKGNAAS